MFWFFPDRILTSVLARAALADTTQQRSGSAAQHGISTDPSWEPRLVMGSISALDPVLQRAGALSNEHINLAYANLLFQLFEQHAEFVFSFITGPIASCYCQAVLISFQVARFRFTKARCLFLQIMKALVSPSSRSQTAASEALGACTRFLGGMSLCHLVTLLRFHLEHVVCSTPEESRHCKLLANSTRRYPRSVRRHSESR